MMIYKTLILFFIYQTLHFMTITLSAPTFNVETKKKSLDRANVVPRILTGVNGTHTEKLLGTIGQYTDASLHRQDIIFPDAFQLLVKRNLGLNSTPRCATKTTHFCENFEAYPFRHINHVLLRNHKHSEFFGIDEEPIEIANRLGEPEETFICASIVKTIFPKAGRNKDDKWKFIINQGDDGTYVQGIRVETCANLDGPCNLLGDTPIGYVTSCKQKFVLRRLLSVSESGQPIPDTFQIPSACCCSFRKDLSSLVESGRSSSSGLKR